MNGTEEPIPLEDDPYADLENFLAGFLLLLLGVIGCYFNVRNCIVMFHIKDYHSSYGYLCIFRSVCNVVNLIPVVIFTAPETLFDVFGSSTEYSRILGLVSGVFYLAIPVVQMAVAFNRCVALIFPMKYAKWCTTNGAKVVMLVGLTVGVISAGYDLAAKCSYVYDRDGLSWYYTDCPRINLDLVFNYPLIFMTVVSILINIFTVLRIMTRKILVTSYQETDSNKLKRNLKLFWQGVLQEVFFANDMLFNTYLGELVDHRIWWFISYTLMWTLGHTLDGVIFFCCNKELRRKISFKNATVSRATSTVF